MNETSVNSADLSWENAENYPDGTMVKTLLRDTAGNALTVLLKLPPGFVMADHSHVSAEHHYILEGEYQVEDKHYQAGHYHLIPGHANHGPFRSKNGAVVLVMWEATSGT